MIGAAMRLFLTPSAHLRDADYDGLSLSGSAHDGLPSHCFSVAVTDLTKQPERAGIEPASSGLSPLAASSRVRS